MTAMQPIDPISIHEFAAPAEGESWHEVDDVVMGGHSRSRFEVRSTGTASFSGTLSLAQGGGFASVRTAPRDFGIAGATAVRLRVLGDGKTYRFRARMDDGLDGVAYQASFGPRSGEWIEVELPWAAFRATFRGRPVADAGMLDPARIRQIGLMIADRQAGRFELRMAWIRGVGPDSSTSRTRR